MSIAFDDALKIARKSVGDMTGDANPEVMRFESKNGFNFLFQTAKGNYEITVEPNGTVGRFSREDKAAIQPQPSKPSNKDRYDYAAPAAQGGITQQEAIEKALSYVGGGRVHDVEPHHGGWEIEISQGMVKGKTKVQVDANGQVYAKKRSRMEMLDFDFD